MSVAASCCHAQRARVGTRRLRVATRCPFTHVKQRENIADASAILRHVHPIGGPTFSGLPAVCRMTESRCRPATHGTISQLEYVHTQARYELTRTVSEYVCVHQHPLHSGCRQVSDCVLWETHWTEARVNVYLNDNTQSSAFLQRS